MSIVDYPSHICGPTLGDQAAGASLSTTQADLNASTDKIEILFSIPRDGTCTGADFLHGSFSTGVTLTVELQTIDPTTGRASGTLYHANATDNTVSPTAAWKQASWSSFTVTRGDKVALVIKPTSGTPSAQRILMFLDGGSTAGPEWPRVIEDDGSAADVAAGPIFSLSYSGVHYYIPGAFAMNGVTNYVFNTGSANDTYGVAIQFPIAVRLTGARIWIDSDGDYELVLLDATKTELTSVQWDKDFPGGFISASSITYLPFDDRVELSANTTYYLFVRATTATSVTLEAQTVYSASHRSAAHPMGENISLAYCDYGAGPWSSVSITTDTTIIPFVDPVIDGIDLSSGGLPSLLQSLEAGIAA